MPTMAFVKPGLRLSPLPTACGVWLAATAKRRAPAYEESSRAPGSASSPVGPVVARTYCGVGCLMAVELAPLVAARLRSVPREPRRGPRARPPVARGRASRTYARDDDRLLARGDRGGGTLSDRQRAR